MIKKLLIPLILLAIAGGGVAYYYRAKRPKPISENLAVPVYPGAQTQTDSFATRLSPRDRARLVKAVVFKSPDAPGKVIQFYKDKLAKEKTQVVETSRRAIPGAVFRTEAGGTFRIVIVKYNEDTTQTEITISSVALPE
jgi:hypothetical protein